MERVEIFTGVIGGKPVAGRPRSAAVLWEIETVVEIPGGWERAERIRSGVPLGATLVGGHVWR